MDRSRWAAWALAAGTMSVAVTGVAAAATSAGSVHYSACAGKKHVLSVESHGKCPKRTTRVTIAGRGPKGAPGARGLPGAAGPSHIYAYDYSLDGGRAPSGGGTPPPLDFTPSATLLTLPSGQYLIHYDIAMDDPANSASGSGTCLTAYLASGQADAALGTTLYVPIAAGVGDGTASLSEPLTVTKPTTVTVKCTAGAGWTVYYFDVTATQTGSLTSAGFTPH